MYLSYIFWCLITALLHYSKKIDKKTFTVFTCLFLFVIMGFRGFNIGPDTYSYCKEFTALQNYTGFFGIPDWNQNVGFTVFRFLLSKITPNDARLYLLVVSAICSYSIFYLLDRYSENVLMSQIMLLSLSYVYFFMSGIKQTLSMSILIFAYDKLREKKNIAFLLLVGLATLFHSTALVFILVLPASKLKLKKMYILLIPLVIIVGILYAKDLLETAIMYLEDTRYAAYGTYYESENNFSGLLIQVAIVIVTLFLSWKKLDDDEMQILLPMYTVGIFFQSMTGVLAEFFRISMFFNIFGVIMLPKAFKLTNKKGANILEAFCVIIFILYFIFFSGPNSAYVPYLF